MRKILMVTGIWFLLSGCASSEGMGSEVDVEVLEGNVMVSVDEVTAETDFSKGDHVVSVDGNTATVMLGGSGSCPPMIVGAIFDSASNMLSFQMYEYGETPCTMDYRQYFYAVELNEGTINGDTDFQFCARGECYTADN
jgi:hypothetical protein